MGLRTRRLVGLGVMAIVGSACTLASPTYITTQQGVNPNVDGGSSPTSAGTPSGGAAGTCRTDDFVKPDLGSLTACAEGKGHCYDKTKVSIGGELVACPNAAEVCVPDEILEANGKPLKSCTSIVGPGGCVTSSLLPRVAAEGGNALQQDVCDADQKCLPCVDPRTQKPTGFCEPGGVHENACTAAADDAGTPALPGCCTTKGKSNGVCFPASAVPPKQLDQTIDDTCAEGQKCLPASLVNAKPVKCEAGALVGKGVCVDRCFNTLMNIAGALGALRQDVCGETEVCIACRFIKDSGAPGCE